MSREPVVEWLRRRRTATLLLFDACVLVSAYLLTALLRYEDRPFGEVAATVLAVAVAAVLVQWVIGMALSLYRGRVGVATLEETVGLGLATLVGGSLVAVANASASPPYLARSIPIGATSLALVLMLIGRGWWRRWQQRAAMAGRTETSRPALVFGAGEAGRQLVSSMRAEAGSPLHPVGLLDDDPWKRRRRLNGVPVLGTGQDLASVAADTGAEVLVIAVPSAPPELIRAVSHSAFVAGLTVKVLPRVSELLSDRVGVHDVRDIDVRDLLGRQPIHTDIASIAGYLEGRRVMVTGAGGSIGAELCHQVQRWRPAELIMLDRDESALHGVQLSLTGRALLDSRDVVLADIRDQRTLRDLMVDRSPHVVFHAAALKHLPMLEQYPHEAWKTNVLGTANLLEASVLAGVERFVNISTDKAADPVSVLGYSKYVAERLTAQVAVRSPGTFLSVRFGNVLGSRGSVLTSLAAQVAAGGPVTVTHPEVTRFFMTIEEAVELVIQAAAIGRDGESLILDMGEPVRIDDVARQLIDQSGAPVEIVYTGLREGEKLHERLLASHEVDRRPAHPLVSHVAVPPLPLSEVRGAADSLSDAELRARLRRWCAVPVSTAHPAAGGRVIPNPATVSRSTT